jgi:hypothetical protein
MLPPAFLRTIASPVSMTQVSLSVGTRIFLHAVVGSIVQLPAPGRRSRGDAERLAMAAALQQHGNIRLVRSNNCSGSNISLACDRSAGITRERVTGGGEQELTRRTFCLSADITAVGHVFFFLGGIMSNPLYRAERCRGLAEECRAIAALCTPSTEIRAHYSRMAQHYSSLAEAEELGTLAYNR